MQIENMLSTAASPKDVYLNFSKAGFLHVDVFVYGAVFQIPSFLGLVALFQRDCHRLLMEREMKRLHKDSLPGVPLPFQWLLSQSFAWGLGQQMLRLAQSRSISLWDRGDQPDEGLLLQVN